MADPKILSQNDLTDTQPAIFAALGILSVSQEISGMAVLQMPDADPELIAEESISLVSVATGRTVEATLPEASDLAEALMITPFLYRDYIIGAAMIESKDAVQGESGLAIGERLERNTAFYAAHLQPGQLPTGSILRNAMLLWMGRISSPGLASGPEQRLDELDFVSNVELHTRLVAARIRQLDIQG